MTDQPSEAALRKACEVLSYDSNYRTWNATANSPYERGVWECIYSLAHHFDAEDRLAREASGSADSTVLRSFVHRHIPPDPKPTAEQVIAKAASCGSVGVAMIAQALRDAGLLREDAQ